MSRENHSGKACNGDCFNCPYPDCILKRVPPDEAFAESRRVNEIIHVSERGSSFQKGISQNHAAVSRKERRHQWYLENREYALAYQREYDKAHRERAREQHKENYRKSKKVE